MPILDVYCLPGNIVNHDHQAARANNRPFIAAQAGAHVTATDRLKDEGVEAATRNAVSGFGGGAVIGALGGLIGLGGAEFRLPLLICAFRFAALEAVILNKAMSLIVVATALPLRATTVPFATVAGYWPVILNLLAGSLVGAWVGATWATRLAGRTLYRVIAGLLVAIGTRLLRYLASI